MNFIVGVARLAREMWKGYQQGWRRIEYPENGELQTPNRAYKSWSPKVEAEGDKSLKSESPQYPWEEWRVVHWDKVVVFKPIVKNKEDAKFTVGFSSKVEDTTSGFGKKIKEMIIGTTNRFAGTEIAANVNRKVSESFFAMRMGPDNCDYFIASREPGLELQLQVVGYTKERKLDDDIKLL